MIDAKSLLFRAGEKARLTYKADLQSLSAWQLHECLGASLMEEIAPQWQKDEADRRGSKQAYYISAEYLLGRLIFNNLLSAGVLKELDKLLGARGIDIRMMEEVEDNAFGNGGLGRLAACYLDSAATHNIPLYGYGLRYRFGLFRQGFTDGKQAEYPDDWSRFGDPFGIRRYDERVTVDFRDGPVIAVPYDLPVIGFNMASIGTLRLWQCEASEEVDFSLFYAQRYEEAAAKKNKAEDITKFLYPNDSGPEGRLLRIKQEYVLSSATIKDLLRRFIRQHGRDFGRLPEHMSVQLNDTHPVMAIPELIRLLEEEGVDFERAFQIAQQSFAYTNHTVMQEALEAWDAQELKRAVPAVFAVVRRINQRLLREIKDKNLSIMRHGRVQMATLAVYATHSVNGVAQIHSQILKDSLFRDWYRRYPQRFFNVTNGVTQRRWLALCNPQLTEFIAEMLGHGRFVTDLPTLAEGLRGIDEAACAKFREIKLRKKRELADIILRQEGIDVPPHFIFDVQIKRLHEYKRQLMNALSILVIYHGLKDGSIRDFHPTAFIIGAKAAPGYRRAKAIIWFINQIAAMVNADPAVQDKLRVVFVRNYNCSYAEHIIPAADISEQISPAGTEASGTGNMKLMLNGAVTLGTYDGANVEIVEEAGTGNNYIFGAKVDEIRKLQQGHYRPAQIYRRSPALKKAIDSLVDGSFRDDPGEGEGTLKELHAALLKGSSWHKADHYFLLHDFAGYMEAKLQAIRDYRDPQLFSRKCLHNVFSAGKFSSDRSVREYARDIWNLRN